MMKDQYEYPVACLLKMLLAQNESVISDRVEELADVACH